MVNRTGMLRGARRRLFAASALALFVELTFIRWIPSVVHVVGFFANVVLIASFLGLGVGMMAARDDSGTRAVFRVGFAVVLLAGYRLLDPSTVVAADSALGINEVAFGGTLEVPLPLVLIGVFGLVAWAMVPFGRLVAEPFDELERIPAYAINIGGSVAGVVAFTAISAVGMPAMVWFGVVLGLLAVHAGTRELVVAAAAVGLALASVHYVDTNGLEGSVLWSPYNQLRTRAVGEDVDDGFVIDVNNQFLLSGLDLSADAEPLEVSESVAEDITGLRTYYDFPFAIARPETALVLGAGAGNDVAAARRAGVPHVTAVEIDRRVAAFGIDHHPEDPYGQPGVELVVDDARSFLRSTDERFDLVLFATLDSHGLLSSTSSVRLESFVYTLESFQDAAAVLADDGVLILSFGPFREEVQLRQYAMIESVFGASPEYFVHANGHRMIVAGAPPVTTRLPDGWRHITDAEVAAAFARHPEARRPATDDWPHLYIRQPGIPLEYGISLAGMTLIGLAMVWRQARRARFDDLPFFFLGGAFLLMETKSVTEFALLIGSTWQTNALVFTVILVIILGANLFVLRTDAGRRWVWPAIIAASLAAHHLAPISVWPDFGAWRLLVAAIYLGTPIFAAGVVFARWFRETRVGSVALGVNLLGAVVGGAVEYVSLISGIRSLALVALAMYALAFLAHRRALLRPAPA